MDSFVEEGIKDKLISKLSSSKLSGRFDDSCNYDNDDYYGEPFILCNYNIGMIPAVDGLAFFDTKLGSDCFFFRKSRWGVTIAIIEGT